MHAHKYIYIYIYTHVHVYGPSRARPVGPAARGGAAAALPTSELRGHAVPCMYVYCAYIYIYIYIYICI